MFNRGKIITYNCIIIDDDAYAIAGLEKYIELVPSLVLQQTYTDPVKALLELSQAEKTDLILVDIDMPQISGIELSRQLREKTDKLVFTTAHTQYGYEAFELSADAYLLKPYSIAKFTSTIAKLFPATAESTAPANDYFFVKNKDENHKLVKIYYKDVIAVESKQNYVLIHTLAQNIMVYMSLTEAAGILGQIPSFVKYHRSFIINRDHISSITGNTLKMSNGLQITVGDIFRQDFLAFLEGKLLKVGRKP